MISAQQLAAICPHLPQATAIRVLPPLQRFLHDGQLSGSPLRVAGALAQIAHECGEFRLLTEIWGPTRAQRSYAHRMGNQGLEDGERYRGHGWIQVTGRDNYRAAGEWIRQRWAELEADELHPADQVAFFRVLDLEKHPELASQHTISAETTLWYWTTRRLNGYCDQRDFDGLTRAINGGLNGIEQRRAYYHRAVRVLGVET